MKLIIAVTFLGILMPEAFSFQNNYCKLVKDGENFTEKYWSIENEFVTYSKYNQETLCREYKTSGGTTTTITSIYQIGGKSQNSKFECTNDKRDNKGQFIAHCKILEGGKQYKPTEGTGKDTPSEGTGNETSTESGGGGTPTEGTEKETSTGGGGGGNLTEGTEQETSTEGPEKETSTEGGGGGNVTEGAEEGTPTAETEEGTPTTETQEGSQPEGSEEGNPTADTGEGTSSGDTGTDTSTDGTENGTSTGDTEVDISTEGTEEDTSNGGTEIELLEGKEADSSISISVEVSVIITDNEKYSILHTCSYDDKKPTRPTYNVLVMQTNKDAQLPEEVTKRFNDEQGFWAINTWYKRKDVDCNNIQNTTDTGKL